MSNYFVRRGTFEMGGCRKMPGGIANTQNNQVGVIFRRDFQDSLARISVSDGGFGTAPKFRSLRNDFVELMHDVGHRVLGRDFRA